ncbi:glycoprotein xg [Limosa lapponica baueri]|uniref:Glycoprotein xg n=1 Tax=Limosa lapponica baueri TaxID=1758121 RepID=A0A2I0U993_LIMLA|nr:glycoprotein xg [Limosa lapponica baueri]
MTSLDLLVTLFLMHPSWPQGHIVGSWSSYCPPGLPGLSPQSCLQQVNPQPVLVQGVIPPQVQHPTLAFVEVPQVPLCPALQPVQVSLDGVTAFWCVSHPFQFCVINKLAEGTFHPFIQIIDEYIEEDWTQY